jgi:putative NADPH-quinone reductase
MSRRIAIIQGHPDLRGDRYGHALARAYAEGATAAGHEVRTIDLARLEFPLLRSKEDWDSGAPPDAVRGAPPPACRQRRESTAPLVARPEHRRVQAADGAFPDGAFHSCAVQIAPRSPPRYFSST